MEETDKPHIIIIGMGEIPTDDLMEAFYDLVISSPSDILNYDETLDNKISKLNNMLKFFEEREQFEKCAKIKEIQSMLNLQSNEN